MGGSGIYLGHNFISSIEILTLSDSQPCIFFSYIWKDQKSHQV